MKNNKHFNLRTGRQGVALLIVLGLLGLLFISATAFAVLMRTERSAATNYRHTSSARHLLFAALNRAIEEIDADIGDTLNPDWEAGTVVVGTGPRARTLRVPDGVLYSYFDDSQVDQTTVPARILTKDVLTYIPARYHRKLTSEEFDPPEWLPMSFAGGPIVGRYAYAVIDTSGMLDASLVGKSNRWTGASMAEVQLDPDLLTVKDIQNVVDFKNSRNAHGRYETVAELASLNTGIDAAKLSNFDVFSRYSTNSLAGEKMVNLFGLNTAKLNDGTFRARLKEAFRDSGLPVDTLLPLCKQNLLFDSLLLPGFYDFIDDDAVMHDGFRRPCTEQLPLPVAFGMTMDEFKRELITPGGGGTDPTYRYSLRNRLFISVVGWPLKDTRAVDGPYRVRGCIRMYNIWAPFPGTIKSKELGINGKDYGISPTETETYAMFTVDEEVKYVDRNERFVLDYLKSSLSAETTSAAPPEFDLDISVAIEVYNARGEMCYQFPGDKTPDLFKNGFGSINVSIDDDFNDWAQFGVRANVDTAKPNDCFWMECVDPRFAFEFPGSDNAHPQWYANRSDKDSRFKLLSTLAGDGYTAPAIREDDRTQALWYNLLDKPALAKKVGLSEMRLDGFHNSRFVAGGKEYDSAATQARMYVANGPITSPGDLGYMLIGPWETIRLYDHWPVDGTKPRDDGYHKVLDYFEVRNPQAEPLGKINLNTASDDVLSLLYLDMPLRSEIPQTAGDDAVTRVAKDKRPEGLGKKLRMELQKKVALTGEPITKLSDLAYLYANVPASVGGYDKNNPNPIWVLDKTCSSAAVGLLDIGEFEREAAIRNVCNLFTVKQQLFTILLRADAFTTRFGSDKLADGTVLSSATAVAQVFRDPVATTQGGVKHHDVTVRMVKILE